MLQDNPLLAQLKQQLHSQTPRAEGTIKAHEKGYGFLETDNKKSYFVSSQNMKNVLNGDKVSGILVQNGDKTAFEPETLLEPALNIFLGQVSFDNKVLDIIPEKHAKFSIRAKVSTNVTHQLKAGDWVKAKLISHPLQDKNGFSAEITQFITQDNTPDQLWLIALARQNLDASLPIDYDWQLIDHEKIERIDLTDLDFFTIDSKETQDMDDALSITRDKQGNYCLQIAIADPSAYIAENSETDNTAYQRCFSTYLPGFTVPMLPKSLSNELCSLKEHQKRPALVCKTIITPDGDIDYQSSEFNLAWVTSKAKLNYKNVSEFIDHQIDIDTDIPTLSDQLISLQELAQIRNLWRQKNALLFKDNHEYRFIFDQQRQLIDIVKESKLTAHKMVEEAMVIANQVFTHTLKAELGFGIFNTHQGFEPKYLDSVVKLLSENQIEEFNKERIATFDGYRDLRRLIQQNELLEYRLRRYQASADFSIEPNAHFGLGFDSYATWTSPIRKYGDLLNHRLLKSILEKHIHDKPNQQILPLMNERRKTVRFAEREVNEKLYQKFLADKIGQPFDAQIIDLNRGGAKVRLTAIGAVAFMPSSLIHPIRNEVAMLPEEGLIKIKEQVTYRLLDKVTVILNEIKTDTSTIIVKNA